MFSPHFAAASIRIVSLTAEAKTVMSLRRMPGLRIWVDGALPMGRDVLGQARLTVAEGQWISTVKRANQAFRAVNPECARKNIRCGH